MLRRKKKVSCITEPPIPASKFFEPSSNLQPLITELHPLSRNFAPTTTTATTRGVVQNYNKYTSATNNKSRARATTAANALHKREDHMHYTIDSNNSREQQKEPPKEDVMICTSLQDTSEAGESMVRSGGGGNVHTGVVGTGKGIDKSNGNSTRSPAIPNRGDHKQHWRGSSSTSSMVTASTVALTPESLNEENRKRIDSTGSGGFSGMLSNDAAMTSRMIQPSGKQSSFFLELLPEEDHHHQQQQQQQQQHPDTVTTTTATTTSSAMTSPSMVPIYKDSISSTTTSCSRSPIHPQSSTLSFRDVYEDQDEHQPQQQDDDDDKYFDDDDDDRGSNENRNCTDSTPPSSLCTPTPESRSRQVATAASSRVCGNGNTNYNSNINIVNQHHVLAPSPAPAAVATGQSFSAAGAIANITSNQCNPHALGSSSATQSQVVKIAKGSLQQELEKEQHKNQEQPHCLMYTNSLEGKSDAEQSNTPSNYSFQQQHRMQHPAPLLYSAIGSLEDPSNNSFASRYHKNKTPAYEFRSHVTTVNEQSSLLMLPQNQRNRNNQQPVVVVGGRGNNKQSRAQQPKKERSPPPPPPTVPSGVGAAMSKQQELTDKMNASVDHVSTGGNVSNRSDNKPKSQPPKKPSNLKKGSTTLKSKIEKDSAGGGGGGSGGSRRKNVTKKVSINEDSEHSNKGNQLRRSKKQLQRQQQPQAMFRPSSDAYTPRMGKKVIKYKPAEMRTPVQQMASPLGTLSRPNFRDALRRVAMIIHQHVVKITRRFESKTLLTGEDGLFTEAMRQTFCEDAYATPTYRCTMVRVPMARPGMVYGLKRNRIRYEIPSEGEIYEFAHRLFKAVQLSSECSIVCLIYVERLMENAKVPLTADTWRPIFMCGLLLASKVWQDLSSWNIEFASVYPQYSLDAINRLELNFLRNVKWDLYISSSCYAKYYFALRSLVEKPDFRQRYNRMVGGVDSVQASEALKIEKRSSQVKEEALLQLSRSM